MIEEKIIVDSNGLIIKGLICRKAEITNHKAPVIIMSHGFTGNMYSCYRYCESLCREGYVCVLFGFCGGGSKYDPEEIRSGGNSYDMTVSSEVADLIAVVSYVEGLDFVDKENIILLGESQGGFVSGLTAAKLGEKIQKLIMIYPALCLPDHARRGCLAFSNYDPKNVPELIDTGSTIVGKGLHEDVVNMDPYLEIAAYKGQVLIIHGDQDPIVDLSYSVKAKSAYEKEQCSLQVVRNMGHSVDDWHREGVIASIRQFLKGKKEIFNFRIVITHSEEANRNGKIERSLYFTGYCESELFVGTILPGGVDRQTYAGEKLESMRAEYSFDGLDYEGKRCGLQVVNKWGVEDWKPEIRTDSKALDWLNTADLAAVLEPGAGGPTIRIFA